MKKKKADSLQIYAIVGSCVSGLFTAGLVFYFFGENLDPVLAGLMALGVVGLEEWGLWVFDSKIPKAKSQKQRNLYFWGMSLLWVSMLISSETFGFISVELLGLKNNILLAKVGVSVISALANFAVFFYLRDRYLDPEMEFAMAKAQAENRISEIELEEFEKGMEKLAKEAGELRAEKRLQETLHDDITPAGVTEILKGDKPLSAEKVRELTMGHNGAAENFQQPLPKNLKR